MFRTSLFPSSRAHDYDIDYHIGRFGLGLLYVGGWSFRSWFVLCWRLGAVRLE